MLFLRVIVVYILAPVFYGLGAFSVKLMVALLNSVSAIQPLNQGSNDLLASLEVIMGLAMMIYGSKYVWQEMVASQEKQKVQESKNSVAIDE